jgi:hypothetical protein
LEKIEKVLLKTNRTTIKMNMNIRTMKVSIQIRTFHRIRRKKNIKAVIMTSVSLKSRTISRFCSTESWIKLTEIIKISVNSLSPLIPISKSVEKSPKTQQDALNLTQVL